MRLYSFSPLKGTSLLRTIGMMLLMLLVSSLQAQTAEPGLWWTKNEGQWLEKVQYKSEIPAGSIYLCNQSITYDLESAEDRELIHQIKEGFAKVDLEDVILRRYAFHIRFENSNPSPELIASRPSRHISHYFIGNDPQRWASSVPSFRSVTYKNLYNKIDLEYTSTGNFPKYNFILYPGANPDDISMSIDGAENITVEPQQLTVQLGFTALTEIQPIAYQIIDGVQHAVSCRFVQKDSAIGWVLPDGYDTRYPLIIDTVQIFGSFSGSTSDNWGYTATFDNSGHLYGGGIVFGTGYPTVTGSYDATFNAGQIDMGISKFSADGSDLLCSTYLGGSGNDIPHSMIVNNAGELLIYGTSGSSDFPMAGSPFDNTFNGGPSVSINSGFILFGTGVDIVLAKLSSDGSSLESSTYLGGSETDGFNIAGATEYNYGDHARGEIVVDALDNIYVASSSQSDNFPVTAGCFDNSYNGGQDAVIFAMNNDMSSLLWSTYMGGAQADGAYSLKLNSSGHVIATGGTASSTFPVTAGSWMDSYSGGSADGWVAKLNGSGTILLQGTFAGTNQYDQSYFVEVDEEDHIYITGQTRGAFPVTADAYSETNGRQFITKLEPDLSTATYSMVFGSGAAGINISPTALLVDDCENVYVSGWGGSVNQSYNPAVANTSGMTTTPDALDVTTDGSDFYFFVLEKNAENLLYASYFGGAGSNEHVDGGTSRFDKAGTIYQAVCAGCGGSDNFPVTPGAWSEVNGSGNCNLGVGKIEFNLAGVYAISDVEPDVVGCAPFTVSFENLSSDAEQYLWDFGDGSTSTVFEPVYTYTTAGTYEVALVVIDSSTCNIADTSYLTVIVYADSIEAAFDVTEVPDCDELLAEFFNVSEVLDGTTYFWDFGDGTTSTLENPVHNYTTPGVYTVQLIITDLTSCNQTDTATYTLSFLTGFNEGFDISTDGCLPLDATFTSSFEGADSYLWDFGDGTSGTGPLIIHTYSNPGIYNVTLTIVVCGIAEVETFQLVVEGNPVTLFDSEPAIGLMNTPIAFNNLSTNASTFNWQFSDGGSSAATNPTYTFNSIGGYEICLTAYNNAGCEDTFCREIQIENEGVIDVPSAFSPNGDGANDVLYVRGFGVKEMEFRLFNRWGELVFFTSDMDIGWDGTFRGQLQEVEVYVYTLTGTFDDNKAFDKQGNISLLR